jgi:transcriptional regulator with XRE-family HTH domain
MTQEDLAAAANISVRNVRKIEAGRVGDPRPSTIRALADAFDLSGTARVVFHEASTGTSEPVGGEPLVIVSIDTTTAHRLNDPMYIEVRVRSAAGEYSVGPFPVLNGVGE